MANSPVEHSIKRKITDETEKNVSIFFFLIKRFVYWVYFRSLFSRVVNGINIIVSIADASIWNRWISHVFSSVFVIRMSWAELNANRFNYGLDKIFTLIFQTIIIIIIFFIISLYHHVDWFFYFIEKKELNILFSYSWISDVRCDSFFQKKKFISKEMKFSVQYNVKFMMWTRELYVMRTNS